MKYVITAIISILLVGCWDVDPGAFELIREKTEKIDAGYTQTYRIEESGSHMRDTIKLYDQDIEIYSAVFLEDKAYLDETGKLIDNNT